MARAREPERTCVGCRSKGEKGGLVRVVRGPGGEVHFDPTGKRPGRGAYVHRDESCLARAARAGVLGRALRAPLSAAQTASLMQEVRAIQDVTG